MIRGLQAQIQRATPLSKLELQNRAHHLNDGTPRPLNVIATPDVPNPKDPNQMDPRSERGTLGLDFGAKGGQDLPKQRVQPEEMKRDFRITERLLIEYGFTVGCRGCETKLKGSGVKPHSISCRRRLEETMRAAGRGDARMRQRKREQRHSHRGGDRTPQSSPEDVPVEPTKKGKLRRPREESKTSRINQARSSDSRLLHVRETLESH